MSTHAQPLHLEKVLGFTPTLVDRDSRSLQRVRLDSTALNEVVGHWRRLPAEQLPHLTGITVSPSEDSRVLLNLLLDLGGNGPTVCLECDLPRNINPPDFSAIWPYSSWWQTELSVFSSVQFSGNGAQGGVKWRQA